MKPKKTLEMHNIKPQTEQAVKPKTTKVKVQEPIFDEIVDLDLTLFRGIGKNHQRSFERNAAQANKIYQTNTMNTSTDSRSVMLSVSDDWKTFALNNRRVPNKYQEELISYNPKQRMLLEKQSMLDSQDLTKVRESMNLTQQSL